MDINEKFNFKLIASLTLIGIGVAFAFSGMGSADALILIRFFISTFFAGALFYPIVYKYVSAFADRGVVVSTILGIYVGGYLVWLLSSLHIVRFGDVSAKVTPAILALLIYIICLYKKDSRKTFFDAIKSASDDILLSEAVFFVIFVVFSWYYGHRIQAFTTERPMDIGFLVTLAKTEYMPPLDMWASGKYINYYYFGQYIITYLAKLSGVDVKYAYSLGMMYIIPVLFIGMYSLVKTILNDHFADRRMVKMISTFGAVISAISATFAGNMHYVITAVIIPFFDKTKKYNYYFANSSRYIGYFPDVPEDRTIIEYPIYSFIIGDLHAHVINIMVVITIMSLLYAYIKNNKSYIRNSENEMPILLYEIFDIQVVLIGFLLAVSSMGNYWDYPIYYVVSGSIILFNNIRKYGIKRDAFITTCLQGVFVLFEVMLFAMPFNLKFIGMNNGIAFSEFHSRLYQLAIIWGYPVLIFFVYLLLMIKKKTVNKTEMYILLIGLCATGLAFMPELVYLRDIYWKGYPRANTMFKLSYQAFIIFAIVLGFVITKLIFDSKKLIINLIGFIGIICFLCCFSYFFVANSQWIGDITEEYNDYKGLDAFLALNNANYRDMEAIDFLEQYVNDNGGGQPIVLETDGESYSDGCRVSMFTGFPTILGWHTHEWLWNNNYNFIEEREKDVKNIYTGDNAEYTRILLDRYNVQYIFIGTREYLKYGEVQEDILESMGVVIYNDDQNVKIIKVE